MSEPKRVASRASDGTRNYLPKFTPIVVAPKATKCTLHEFFAVWSQMQIDKTTGGPWEIPDFHIEILDFLSDHKNWENHTGLMQVFRGAAKSTILGIFIVWMLTQDQKQIFLILSADKKTAGKITTDVANIIMKHPFAKHLHGDQGAWRQDTLVVEGADNGRNPSITSWGVKSNLTGGRATWIIYDDVEVPKNSGSETEREVLREKLDEPTHILVPGGFELFVGTPHSFDSIYTELEGTSGKEEPFRSGCTSLKIPVMTDVTGSFPYLVGTPTWPTRFSEVEIAKRQSGSKTKGHFLSQYLLQPYNPEDTVLDPTLILTYDGEIDVHASNGGTLAKLKFRDAPSVRVLGVTAFWDPSLAKMSSDDSVLAVVYTTEDGHYYIHRTVKLLGDAEDQSKQVMAAMKECEVSHVIIETSGVGGFLPPVFRKAAEGSGLTCDGQPTTQNKQEKIMHAYEVRLSGGYVHAHTSVMESAFRTQLRDFSPRGHGRSKDDYIDAVAMAILAEPIRIKSLSSGASGSQWRSSGGSEEAGVDPVSF